MTQTFDDEPVSGFIKPVNIINDVKFTDFTSVSSRGYCQLTRAKRHGRWWMLKGLKESYRQDSVYQVLLQKEYEITSQLQHPMVVSVFSLEEVEGLGLCIVMEWIEGLTLKDWLLQGNHTSKERRYVAEMLLEALIYVHSRQTQHRDLKPSNIIITHDSRHLKLIDFGLSDTDSHTILKAPAGTEGYMAPEGPSDIYSLGCILRGLRLGRPSHHVVRKCQAPLSHRYKDVPTVQKNLHRCWAWPRRLLLIICLVVLLSGIYLLNISHTRQGLRTVSDSLKVLKEYNAAKSQSEQIKSDSLLHQLNQINAQRQKEETIKDNAREKLLEAKRQIDRQLQAYGIQQMLDTVSCQRHITIPFLRITDEMIQKTTEPELKDYINEKYRKPWIKQMSELPFD